MFPIWVSYELESVHDPAEPVRDFLKWSLKPVSFVLTGSFLTGVFSTRQAVNVVKEMICRFKAGSLDPSHVMASGNVDVGLVHADRLRESDGSLFDVMRCIAILER